MFEIEANTKEELKQKLTMALYDIAFAMDEKAFLEDPVSLVLSYTWMKEGKEVWSNTLILNVREELNRSGVLDMIHTKVSSEVSRFDEI